MPGWLQMILGLVVGYWIAEWPHRLWVGERWGTRAGDLPTRSMRWAGRLFGVATFVLALVLGAFLFGLISPWTPGIRDPAFCGSWPIFGFACFGLAVGLFELGAGLTPAGSFMEKSPRFLDELGLAQRVGAGRLVSCGATLVVLPVLL